MERDKVGGDVTSKNGEEAETCIQGLLWVRLRCGYYKAVRKGVSCRGVFVCVCV